MSYASLGAGVSRPWGGGEGNACVGGTFAGETVTFEASPDEGTTWIKVGDDGVFTDEGWAAFNLASGVLVRFTVAGGSGAGLGFFVTGKIQK